MIILGGSAVGVNWYLDKQLFWRCADQWQPTLTVHDPNPPLTLEDAPAPPPPPSGGTPSMMLTGVGGAAG